MGGFDHLENEVLALMECDVNCTRVKFVLMRISKRLFPAFSLSLFKNTLLYLNSLHHSKCVDMMFMVYTSDGELFHYSEKWKRWLTGSTRAYLDMKEKEEKEKSSDPGK